MRFDNINLLRAFAALLVMVYHVIEHMQWVTFPASGPLIAFRLGWAGVDLFFVISGFVITYSALLLYRREPAEFQRTYWRRRLARILPLYLLTMTLWIALIWDGFFLQATKDWAWQLFTHLTFIHSFFADTHGSIDGANWSLALEMQFYLLIALLIRWIDRTPAWRLLAYGIAISWAWRGAMLILHGNGDAFTLFRNITQLPGTLDAFGAGMFLAKLTLDRPSRRFWIGCAWALGAAVFGYLTIEFLRPRASYWDIPHMVVFWRTALALVFMAVIAAAIQLPQIIGNRWMRPLNDMGEISYGIYLWHLFAIEFVRRVGGVGPLEGLIIVLALTGLASVCSWLYMEKPIMEAAR